MSHGHFGRALSRAAHPLAALACAVALSACGGGGDGDGGGTPADPSGFTSAVPASATGTLSGDSQAAANALVAQANQALFDLTQRNNPLAAAAAPGRAMAQAATERAQRTENISSAVCRNGGSATVETADATYQRLERNALLQSGDYFNLGFQGCELATSLLGLGSVLPAGAAATGRIFMRLDQVYSGAPTDLNADVTITSIGLSLNSGGTTIGPKTFQMQGRMAFGRFTVATLDNGSSRYYTPVLDEPVSGQPRLISGTARSALPGVAGVSGYFDFVFSGWQVSSSTGRALAGSVQVRGANGQVQAVLTAGGGNGQAMVSILNAPARVVN